MSSEPAPDNGFYSGVIYNPNFFPASTNPSGDATEEWVNDNFLQKTGEPTDNATSTTFEGLIISTNQTSSSSNGGAIYTEGGMSCNDLYVQSGYVNGPQTVSLFGGAEDVQIGNQNNATVSVGLLQVNNSGYGINNNGPLYCGGQITTPNNIQGYYLTATEALVSENLYESVTGQGTGNPTVYCASPNVSIATQASTINIATTPLQSNTTINYGTSASGNVIMNCP